MEKEMKTSQILAYLFGGVFTLIYRIYIECKQNRINRRRNQILIANSLYYIT